MRLSSRISPEQSPLTSVSALRRKLRSLPCSSSPHRNRFAGLRRGPHASPAKRVAWGEEAQRNERALPLAAGRGIWSLCRRGEGKARRQMHTGGPVRAPVLQLHGNGRQGEQIVVLHLGLVLLERLAARAHHIKPAVQFQHILAGIRLMLVLHQPGGEGEVGRFHGSVAMVNADGDGFAHLEFLRSVLIFLLFLAVARASLMAGLVTFQVSLYCRIWCCSSSGVIYLAHSLGR